MSPIKAFLLTFALFLTCSVETSAQSRVIVPPVYGYVVIEGDTLAAMRLATIPVYSSRWRKRVSLRKYERLVRAVKLVYPMAREAQERLAIMEDTLPKLATKKEQSDYVKQVEREIKAKYTPILKKMSMYQGMVLIKLIDRQTGSSSYELVQEFRGRFAAFFWQGIAKLFGGDLKAEYDPLGDDALLEQLIELYELGLL